jgi:hypothetical protein
MLKMADPISHKGSSIILLLCLCIFSMMVILSPQVMGSSDKWFDQQSFEQHHLFEFEEELFLFVLLVLIMFGVMAGQLRAAWQPAGSLYPLPQLPPPK